MRAVKGGYFIFQQPSVLRLTPSGLDDGTASEQSLLRREAIGRPTHQESTN